MRYAVSMESERSTFDVWRGTATTSFAVLQTVAAYGLSFLFSSSGGDYRMLFAIGAASLTLALTVDLFAALGTK